MSIKAMENLKLIEYPKLDEKLYVAEYHNGLKMFIIPKKGYLKKFAAFTVNYGSINDAFMIPGEEKIIKIPDGTAHFLEHKLFEQEEQDIMGKFSEFGASPNAYTSFNQTAYLFSCTYNFEKSLELLLNFVQSPYFTEKSIENEKNIIEQEIKMYDDNPEWRVFFNLLKALYGSHPVSIDIAGTVESISKIDKDILYKCYNSFYIPSNMMLIVVGDVDPSKVFDNVAANIKMSEKNFIPITVSNDYIEKVHEKFIEQNLHIASPIFRIGFKDIQLKNGVKKDTKDLLKREVIVEILLEMLFGESSELYDQLYCERLINSTFSTEYTIEPTYAFSVLGGESPDPIRANEKIISYITQIHSVGLDKSAYERLLKASKGKYIQSFNSVDRIAKSFISAYSKNATIFDYLDIYDNVTLEYAQKVFTELFCPDRSALSVVRNQS